MRICYLQQPADCHPGHQGDAPQPDHGGLQQPASCQVCRHPEGQGAEEDPADADQHLEPGYSEPRQLRHARRPVLASCEQLHWRGWSGHVGQPTDHGRGRVQRDGQPLHAERAAGVQPQPGLPAVPTAAAAVHGAGPAAPTISTSDSAA